MNESAASPLLVGDRVRDTRNRTREGVVTVVRTVARKHFYMVRWAGLVHDSGEYGVRRLELIRG